MQKILCLTATLLCCVSARSADWLTDGFNSQRTGWQTDEHILTTANVKDLKVLWKLQTGNQSRALHSLMPALVIGRIDTPSGPKQLALVSGISDNLYAIDVDAGQILWQKHFNYTPPATTVPNLTGSTDPAHLGFLDPGGSSDTPVIGPPDAAGKRAVYMVDGGGMLHSLNVADGEDLLPPFKFATGKGWSLNLWNNTIFMPHAGEISAVSLDDPTHKIMTWSAGRGGLWGLRGAAVDSTGTAWSTTGDGPYEPEHHIYANSVIAVDVEDGQLKLKDWFTPRNWAWLQKRDLDPNVTSVIFTYKGRELLVSGSKEGRMWLLDPKSPGGPDHMTPLYKTPLICNEEVDFQDNGIWGALSTWEDADGIRWVLAPFWGPVHSQFKFPITNGPVKEGGVAAFKLEDKAGNLELTPVWVSRDMKRGAPPVIANGVVFAYGTGDFTQQASPDKGLDFDSSIRAAKSTHATLYALDAKTGKELYSSGDQIPAFNHFSGLSVANGRVYLGTYDGFVYCFGIPQSLTQSANNARPGGPIPARTSSADGR